jgi:hypothetical protein
MLRRRHPRAQAECSHGVVDHTASATAPSWCTRPGFSGTWSGWSATACEKTFALRAAARSHRELSIGDRGPPRRREVSRNGQRFLGARFGFGFGFGFGFARAVFLEGLEGAVWHTTSRLCPSASRTKAP